MFLCRMMVRYFCKAPVTNSNLKKKQTQKIKHNNGTLHEIHINGSEHVPFPLQCVSIQP